jgi:hypothetical protein
MQLGLAFIYCLSTVLSFLDLSSCTVSLNCISVIRHLSNVV